MPREFYDSRWEVILSASYIMRVEQRIHMLHLVCMASAELLGATRIVIHQARARLRGIRNFIHYSATDIKGWQQIMHFGRTCESDFQSTGEANLDVCLERWFDSALLCCRILYRQLVPQPPYPQSHPPPNSTPQIPPPLGPHQTILRFRTIDWRVRGQGH